jgi:hypothetical protein
MSKHILWTIIATVLFLFSTTITPAATGDICPGVKETVRNAVNALQDYYSANGKYPDQLSGTAFVPPEQVIVIYEKMNIYPGTEIFMVRAYGENCGTMYIATPGSQEPHEIPMTSAAVLHKAANRAAPGASPGNGASQLTPILVSLAIFFLVFVLIILIFFKYYKKSARATQKGKEVQSLPTDSE